MTYKLRLQGSTAILTFPAKPGADVLAVVKGFSMRWDRFDAAWVGRVDMDRLTKSLDKVMGIPAKPDAPCWICKSPGFLRPRGPFDPVHCDDCHAKDVEQRNVSAYVAGGLGEF